MPITNPSAINMAIPLNRVDNIIGIHSGSFVVAAPTFLTSPTSASDPYVTGFNDTCLFEGIFSVDGGTTWNDFGAMKPNLSTPGQPVIQTVTCQGWVTPGGTFTAYANNYYDNVHSSGSSYTVQYKVVFLAKDDQGPINPVKTNESIYWLSKYNYQKIFRSGSFANSTVNPTPIVHNLGYVPKVRAWGTATGSVYPNGSMLSYDWFGGSNFNIGVDGSAATFDAITGYGTVNVFWRIYLDS